MNDSKKGAALDAGGDHDLCAGRAGPGSPYSECRFQRFAQILIDHDRLTEAWNYNRFLSEGRKRLKRAPLLQAVVTMDIKNFKVINANYSYETGNDILVGISSLLNHFTGGGGVLCQN